MTEGRLWLDFRPNATNPNPTSMDATSSQGSALVRMQGQIDAQSAPQLSRLLDHDDLLGFSIVLLDMGDITFIDSAGLRALIRITQRAQAHRRHLHVVNPSAPVARIFDLTGAWRAVPIWPQASSF